MSEPFSTRQPMMEKRATQLKTTKILKRAACDKTTTARKRAARDKTTTTQKRASQFKTTKILKRASGFKPTKDEKRTRPGGQTGNFSKPTTTHTMSNLHTFRMPIEAFIACRCGEQARVYSPVRYDYEEIPGVVDDLAVEAGWGDSMTCPECQRKLDLDVAEVNEADARNEALALGL